MYKTNIQINFKSSMLKSILCDYSNVYIVVSRNITVDEVARGRGNINIQV